ncbi:cytochrome P450 27C1-like [Dendronephthya gigantea]|uniref:cytochrome P450 27C1-like n=1 Tax=Dendronephthya gigantea TaxID=151771 RepID=UPI00106A5176|nr:cytochrome P450 27C1-like [Dendronephthya gigantea]
MRCVNIADARTVEKVLRTDQRFQMRPGLEAVNEIIDEISEDGESFKITSNNYDEWQPHRALVSPRLLRPKEVKKQFPLLNSVANDFMKRLNHLSEHDETVRNFEDELTFWSIESTSAFLFNHRLGFYDHPPDPIAVEFTEAAMKMLSSLTKILHSGPFHKYTRAGDTFKTSLLTMHKTYLAIYDRFGTSGEQAKTDIRQKQTFHQYLSSQGKTPHEIVWVISGLMAGGIETTSTTCLWLLYQLAQHQEIQERLYQELASSLGPDEEISADKIPLYLKAALKESQRIYPTASVVPRAFDKDIELHGYHIPAGVNVLIQNHLLSVNKDCHGEDAKKFEPERWMRDDVTEKKHKINPFSSLPFGHGVRMCLGKRVAESTIYTLVSKILLSYRLEYADEKEVKRSFIGGIMRPDTPIRLRFKRR